MCECIRERMRGMERNNVYLCLAGWNERNESVNIYEQVSAATVHQKSEEEA